MADLKIVNFPQSGVLDVPQGLRALADAIEQGKYGDVVGECHGGERK